jgi:hypothetical protein
MTVRLKNCTRLGWRVEFSFNGHNTTLSQPVWGTVSRDLFFAAAAGPWGSRAVIPGSRCPLGRRGSLRVEPCGYTWVGPAPGQYLRAFKVSNDPGASAQVTRLALV